MNQVMMKGRKSTIVVVMEVMKTMTWNLKRMKKIDVILSRYRSTEVDRSAPLFGINYYDLNTKEIFKLVKATAQAEPVSAQSTCFGPELSLNYPGQDQPLRKTRDNHCGKLTVGYLVTPSNFPIDCGKEELLEPILRSI
ncbi:hypothetical protein CR513_63010, partial [Mucuna pruriens]